MPGRRATVDILVIVAVLAGPGAAPARAAGADLRALIRDAVAEGKPKVVLPPGTYRMAPEPKEAIVIPVRKARDLEIVADGVTLVCTKRTRALEFRECRNVTLRGLTIDYDPLTFTQGQVVAVADDRSWIDVKIHAGYPVEPWARIDVVDAATRFRKKGMPFLWGTTAQVRPPDTVRVSLKGIGDAAKVGDLASLSTGNDPGGICHALTLEHCEGGMVLQDVTLHAAPGMGIVESFGAGGTLLRRVRIVAGPKPAGATEARLLTTSWDGILHTTVRKGPTVESCVIAHCGDDSWSVQSQDYLVLARAGASVVVAPRGSLCPFKAGDRLQASLDAPFLKIVSVEPVQSKDAGLAPGVVEKLEKAKPWTKWKVNKVGWVRARLDAEPLWEAGQAVYCPDWQGNGFVFRGNRVHSPGRVLIKAGDGLVEGNTLTTPHGVVVCPELGEQGAAGIRNLVIRGNTIAESGYFCPAPWSTQAGALSITCGEGGAFRSPPAFDGIVIENNTWRRIRGVNLVVASARNVMIRGNRFLETHQQKPDDTGASYRIDQQTVVWLAQCEGVSLSSNVVEGLGPNASKALGMGPGVRAVEGAEAGLKVKSP